MNNSTNGQDIKMDNIFEAFRLSFHAMANTNIKYEESIKEYEQVKNIYKNENENYDYEFLEDNDMGNYGGYQIYKDILTGIYEAFGELDLYDLYADINIYYDLKNEKNKKFINKFNKVNLELLYLSTRYSLTYFLVSLKQASPRMFELFILYNEIKPYYTLLKIKYIKEYQKETREDLDVTDMKYGAITKKYKKVLLTNNYLSLNIPWYCQLLIADLL